MANVTRFDPFGNVGAVIRDFWGRPWAADLEMAPQMKMDVSENEQGYTVKAEIPGVNKEDVKVEIDGNQVSITAEVKKESEQKKGETTLRSERYYGRQYRSFSLGHDVDEGKAQAKYDKGVLELVLPKKAGTSAGKQLKVQ